MKNNIAKFFTLLVMACILFASGCTTEAADPVPHTDPAFLEGTWSNAGASFKIDADLNFVCDLVNVNLSPTSSDIIPAQVKGKITYDANNLGPDQYIIKGMAVTSAEDDEYDAKFSAGNTSIGSTISALFQNLECTLVPNAVKTSFEFSSSNAAASGFFSAAGPYIKK